MNFRARLATNLQICDLMLSKYQDMSAQSYNMNSIFLRYRALIIAFFLQSALFFDLHVPAQTEVEISKKETYSKIDGYAYFTKIPAGGI